METVPHGFRAAMETSEKSALCDSGKISLVYATSGHGVTHHEGLQRVRRSLRHGLSGSAIVPGCGVVWWCGGGAGWCVWEGWCVCGRDTISFSIIHICVTMSKKTLCKPITCWENVMQTSHAQCDV